MTISEETIKQLEDLFQAAGAKLSVLAPEAGNIAVNDDADGPQPTTDDAEGGADGCSLILSDIYCKVSAPYGEIIVTDDDDNELARANINCWADLQGRKLYDMARGDLRSFVRHHEREFRSWSLIHPFSVVLCNAQGSPICDVYQIDDESIIIEHEDLMKGLNKDLNAFINDLLKS